MEEFKPLSGEKKKVAVPPPPRDIRPSITDEVQAWEKRQVVWRAIERAFGWAAIGFAIGWIAGQAVMR